MLSSGGLVQGVAGQDEAFAITLAIGITVIYAGFLVAAGAGASVRSPRERRQPEGLARASVARG